MFFDPFLKRVSTTEHLFFFGFSPDGSPCFYWTKKAFVKTGFLQTHFSSFFDVFRPLDPPPFLSFFDHPDPCPDPCLRTTLFRPKFGRGKSENRPEKLRACVQKFRKIFRACVQKFWKKRRKKSECRKKNLIFSGGSAFRSARSFVVFEIWGGVETSREKNDKLVPGKVVFENTFPETVSRETSAHELGREIDKIFSPLCRRKIYHGIKFFLVTTFRGGIKFFHLHR